MNKLLPAGALVAVLMALVSPRPALAHRLLAECRLRGDQVEVEAFYDDDTPAGNARVAVLDAQKNTVAEGRTDAEGRWTFPAPAAGTYQVVVNAGAGHRAQISITLPGGKSAGTESPHTPSNLSPKPAGQETGASPTIHAGPTRAEAVRFPWVRVGIGLALIAALSLVLWFFLQRIRPPAAPTEQEPAGDV
ncbi:MAG TPA: carboxypeptidase-like regulatory domain-containing protein [Gemmataceae bacterium]|jgi:hypothetical protein|nr:carboxypeptidase-like regulatory domain-containing protein [Gemmataceae bacterium]